MKHELGFPPLKIAVYFEILACLIETIVGFYMDTIKYLREVTNMNIITKLFPELEGQSGAVVGIYLGTLVVLWLLLALAQWKMYTKMGEPGWKSLIPIYSIYVLLKRCSRVKYFWHAILAGVALFVVDLIYNLVKPSSDAAVFYVLFILELILLIYFIVIEIKIKYHVSKSFGHGVGYTIGLILLPYIFDLILGFGSSEYQKVID